jgi:hypothetical protein
LEETIEKLQPKVSNTFWSNYYTFTNYSEKSFKAKKRLVIKNIRKVRPRLVWDLGANTGEFSKLSADYGAYTVAFDSDINTVQKHFSNISGKNADNTLPLLMDLSNPSPNRGWAGKERASLDQRSPADLILALALLHHLCFTNNLPFSYIAEYFSRLGKYLLIEFVPQNDSQIKEMIQNRENIFTEYNEVKFLEVFSHFFKVESCEPISDSGRTLYLFKSMHDFKKK